MKIVDWKKTEIMPTKHKLDARRIYDHDEAQVVHLAIKAGESLVPHITPVDVIFFVLEGEIDVRIGDETITVGKENLVESPKDIVHCLSNSSDALARILVLKTPKPTTATKFL